jgi:hypothetical protein
MNNYSLVDLQLITVILKSQNLINNTYLLSSVIRGGD